MKGIFLMSAPNRKPWTGAKITLDGQAMTPAGLKPGATVWILTVRTQRIEAIAPIEAPKAGAH
jgi:hypothetical protein